MRKTFIIAEAGVNHNGSLDMAIQLVDEAADAGVDAVKFQTFKSERVISRFAQKAEYQKTTTGAQESQLEMVKKLELGRDAHIALTEECLKRKIKFLSTPFDFDSLNLLVDDLKLELLKIPSGEITNAPFLLEIARKGKSVIFSTGMSTLGEVETALGVLAFGYVEKIGKPSLKSFQNAFFSEVGQRAIQRNVSLLHCTTEYPAPFEDVNLRAMDTLSAAFGLPVGLSDHTEGIAVPVAAVARGASIIEKHFTLDRSLPGPDHRASLDPQELKNMVKSIREVEKALGGSAKKPTPSEMKNREIVRKSLVANCEIKKGDTFSSKNISMKRPGYGISPLYYWDYLEKLADNDYLEDEMIHG